MRPARAVLLVAALLFLVNIWGYDLWAPDEPFFGEGAREMVVDGRWLVTHVNGDVNTHKPPLFFWLIALLSLPLGRVTSLTARLPSALAALGTVAMVLRELRRLEGLHTSLEAAAALPVNYATAWTMLVRLGSLQPGETVLVHSAGGGVGIAALQICRWRGAVAIGTASAGKHARLKELGYAHCIDYRSQDFEKEVMRYTAGRGVDVVLDGKAALSKTALNSYDVVVLDRNLPLVHGDDVCRELVARQSLARILMLTAAGSVQDRVTGLDLGADDYLPKPFALKELVARIRRLGRRAVTPVPPVLAAGDLVLDPARHVAERNGRDLGLTKKEFGVLEVLLAAEGRVVSAEELLEKVWDENTDPFTNVVRVTIMTLRRKVGDPPLIETVAGVGYKI